MVLKMPFFPNTRDNTHCYQATLRMILKKIYPKRNFSYRELEKVFDKPKGKYSWTPAAAVNLKKSGLNTKIVSPFDYKKFSRDGRRYIMKFYSKEAADVQIKMSNIESEMENARKMVRRGLYSKDKVKLNDLEKFLKSGWFVIAQVNSRALSRKSGYSGHAVTILGTSRKYIYFHDPGGKFTPRPNRRVSKKIFVKAFENEVFLVKP